jgi:hypothetical protein
MELLLRAGHVAAVTDAQEFGSAYTVVSSAAKVMFLWPGSIWHVSL